MKKLNFVFVFFFAVLILLASAQSAEKPAEENPNPSGKFLWSGNFLVFSSSPDNGFGIGLQTEYFFTEHFSLAGLIGTGAAGLPFGTGSSAFIYTAKVLIAPLGSKSLVFPYIGYGVGRAQISNNTIYNIPAYYADANYPVVGLKGVFGMFNSHIEVDMLSIAEKGYSKSGQMWSLGFGFSL